MKQLYTRWGKKIDPEHVLSEYPRPLLVRDSYINLNGILGVCIYGCFSEAGEIRWKDIGAIFTGSSTVRSESSIAAGGISVVQAYHRCE